MRDAASRHLRPPICCARGARARRRSARRRSCSSASADDLAERLAAVLRQVRSARSISARRATRCGACSPERQGRRDRRGRSAAGQLAADGLAVAADEEALPFRDGSLDLVVSALALQFVNDLPGALDPDPPRAQAGRAVAGRDARRRHADRIAPGVRRGRGEIEGGVSPRVAPFADLRELGALLQRAGFALPVTDVERRHGALRARRSA